MSYGDAFNAEGGGVYAMEWDEDALRIWHFPRSGIPDDIVLPGGGPDPESWGPPQAVFGGAGCDPETYFYDLSLVINIVGPPVASPILSFPSTPVVSFVCVTDEIPFRV